MRDLATHLRCLRELEASGRPPSRASALGLIAGGVLVAVALAGSCLLEQLVLDRLGR